MKIFLAQLDVKAGDPQANVRRMIEMIDEARAKGASLVVFPEHAVGGYFVGDRWLEEDWLQELLSYNEDLRLAAGYLTVVYGNVAVDKEKRGRDGRFVRYNAVYVIHNGQIYYEVKTLLPNYRIFDDERYFTSRPPGRRPLFEVEGQQMGVVVCEDMWSNDYDSDPVLELLDQGADFVVSISASPWTYGKNASRDRQIAILEKKAGKLVPFYYVNNVGVQNNGKNLITFDGNSAVYAEGQRLHRYDLPPYQEGLIEIDNQEFLFGGVRGLPSKIEQNTKQ